MPKLGDLILCDSKGIVEVGRTDLNVHKRELAAKHGNDVQGYVDDKDPFIRSHS